MIWYDPLFLGTGCQSKQKMLKRRISRRLEHPPVFLITLPTGSGGVLEIIPSAQLLQKHYPADDLRVIGMAYTRTEALFMVEHIISESFRARGDADIEAYLSSPDNRGQVTT